MDNHPFVDKSIKLWVINIINIYQLYLYIYNTHLYIIYVVDKSTNINCFDMAFEGHLKKKKHTVCFMTREYEKVSIGDL